MVRGLRIMGTGIALLALTATVFQGAPVGAAPMNSKITVRLTGTCADAVMMENIDTGACRIAVKVATVGLVRKYKLQYRAANGGWTTYNSKRTAASGFSFGLPRLNTANRWLNGSWTFRVQADRAGALGSGVSRLIKVRYVPYGGSREYPVALGTSGTLTDNWVVSVVDTLFDATDLVLYENMFNSPPSIGASYVMVRVRATYTGSGSDSFDGSYRLRLVGSMGVTYSTFQNSCGVIPDPVTYADVFTGGTIEGNLCWQVATIDIPGLQMYDDRFLGNDWDRVFFALH